MAKEKIALFHLNCEDYNGIYKYKEIIIYYNKFSIKIDTLNKNKRSKGDIQCFIASLVINSSFLSDLCHSSKQVIQWCLHNQSLLWCLKYGCRYIFTKQSLDRRKYGFFSHPPLSIDYNAVFPFSKIISLSQNWQVPKKMSGIQFNFGIFSYFNARTNTTICQAFENIITIIGPSSANSLSIILFDFTKLSTNPDNALLSSWTRSFVVTCMERISLLFTSTVAMWIFKYPFLLLLLLLYCAPHLSESLAYVCYFDSYTITTAVWCDGSKVKEKAIDFLIVYYLWYNKLGKE